MKYLLIFMDTNIFLINISKKVTLCFVNFNQIIRNKSKFSDSTKLEPYTFLQKII